MDRVTTFTLYRVNKYMSSEIEITDAHLFYSSGIYARRFRKSTVMYSMAIFLLSTCDRCTHDTFFGVVLVEQSQLSVDKSFILSHRNVSSVAHYYVIPRTSSFEPNLQNLAIFVACASICRFFSS